MPEELSEKELRTLSLIASFPIAHVEGEVVDGLILRGFLRRADDGTLRLTTDARRHLGRWHPRSV